MMFFILAAGLAAVISVTILVALTLSKRRTSGHRSLARLGVVSQRWLIVHRTEWK
jgi:hypothetical protein